MRISSDRLARWLFGVSLAALVFAYGVAVGKYELFPHSVLELASQGFRELRGGDVDHAQFFYHRVAHRTRAPRDVAGAYQGLNLVTRIGNGKQICVEILDMNGAKIHEWDVDWFRLWPDAKHVPARSVPKSRPGTHVHGCVLMDDGDIVFNYEYCGLIRVDRQGGVVWRLPYQTHHSVHRHSDGNLWVCGQKYYAKPDAQFPNRDSPFGDDTILEVTPDGKIAQEWSVAELLLENGLPGMVHLGSLQLTTQLPTLSDIYHLNDVEPFPSDMEEGFFEYGDILISLRNINTVLAFNRHSRTIKFISAGRCVRQHDADFIDGSTISVFDNNHISPKDLGQQSRIIVVTAPDNASKAYFSGNDDVPFYTSLMGKHQWLPNGNLLITESMEGRAFEINREGKLVWDYVNYIDDGVVGIVEEVQRIPLEYARFFEDNRRGAAGPTPR